MSPRTTVRRPLRAIIYVRVSSYDLAADEAANSSPEVQRARSLARVTAEGWELAAEIGDSGVIYDLDESGSDKGMRLNRPGLLLARNAIKARRADVIVSLRLDRLARNTIDLLTLADELEQHGGAFALAEGDINTAGPYGKLILTIIAAIAEMEAKVITARTMAGARPLDLRTRCYRCLPRHPLDVPPPRQLAQRSPPCRSLGAPFATTRAFPPIIASW